MTTPTQTPGKNPFVAPSKALAAAIDAEWANQKTFNAAKMPFTTLVYTAIDRVEQAREGIIEVLLAYVETDTLCYHAANPKLAERQKQQWGPMLEWAGNKFGHSFAITSDVMPVAQSDALTQAMKDYLGKLNDMQLAAIMMLSTLYSSLILAIAVFETHISSAEAFGLSRLEEQFQGEQWGVEEAAELRAQKMAKEASETAEFLRLLDKA